MKSKLFKIMTLQEMALRGKEILSKQLPPTLEEAKHQAKRLKDKSIVKNS